jgi:F-type H+-transporting ATPase subunit b
VPDEIGEMFWGAVAFFGLWALMRYVLLPPLLRVREERRNQELSDLEAAEAAREQATQVRRDYDATLAEARSVASSVLEEARAAAEAERGQVVAAAESEIAAERQQAIRELEEQRTAAVGGLDDDVADLAVAAASKVLAAAVDPAAARPAVVSHLEAER